MCVRPAVGSGSDALVKGFVVDTLCDDGESSVLFSKSMSDRPALSAFVATLLLRLWMRASARSLAYGQPIARLVVTYAQNRRQSSTGGAEPQRLSRRHGGGRPMIRACLRPPTHRKRWLN